MLDLKNNNCTVQAFSVIKAQITKYETEKTVIKEIGKLHSVVSGDNAQTIVTVKPTRKKCGH